MDDWALLSEFVGCRSQDAFLQLVERHLPMVYSTAQRIVYDSHLAQEVAQNVFVTLARKAKALHPPQVIGGWLYNTTRHIALNTVRTEQRRREREQTAIAMQSLNPAGDDPRIAEHLEPAMAELEPEERDVLVLRYLEDRSLREVGVELGISEDAARMRVNRALERLRAGFNRKGVAVSAVLLATALPASTSPLPAGLGAAIASAALAGSSGAIVTTAKVAALLGGVVTVVLLAFVLRSPVSGTGQRTFVRNGVELIRPEATNSGLSGHVLLAGRPPPERVITMDPACSRVHPTPVTTRTYRVGTNGGLGDVLVYVKTGAPTNFQFSPLSAVLLDNSNCLFQPFVFALMTNQTVVFRNSDPVLHNVHGTMRNNQEFNFALGTLGATATRNFSRPEMFAALKCDVHPWMYAYVCVLDHPWFAVTDADGFFQFPWPLPPGQYTVAAAHRVAGEVTQTVVISTGQTNSPLRFKLEVKK